MVGAKFLAHFSQTHPVTLPLVRIFKPSDFWKNCQNRNEIWNFFDNRMKWRKIFSVLQLLETEEKFIVCRDFKEREKRLFFINVLESCWCLGRSGAGLAEFSPLGTFLIAEVAQIFQLCENVECCEVVCCDKDSNTWLPVQQYVFGQLKEIAIYVQFMTIYVHTYILCICFLSIYYLGDIFTSQSGDTACLLAWLGKENSFNWSVIEFPKSGLFWLGCYCFRQEQLWLNFFLRFTGINEPKFCTYAKNKSTI
jgi:hypothetical protein